jgi:pSer/pThr/pTyr-binding forkhead associated (FHA) protein
VITCSRCGKENQDLYKFCLGCGAKLQTAPAPGAAPAPKPAPPADGLPPTPPPEFGGDSISVAKTAVPPEPVGFSAMGPTIASAGAAFGAMPGQAQLMGPTPPPPAQSPAFAPPAAATPASGPRPPAAAAVPASAPSVQIGLGSVPMQVPVRQSPLPASPAPAAPSPLASPIVATSVPATAVPAMQPAPHVSPFSPPPVETVACPNCGKQVASAFAFCGGCGHRMKPVPGAVAEAAIARADAVAPVPARIAPQGHLTLIRPDGTEGGVCPLHEGANLIGRGQGPLFDADPYLSPRHAEFVLSENALEVRDLHSLNGIFVRITEEEPLESGDSFRIGQELLRFDAINQPTPLEDGTEIIGTPNPGYWGRLSVVVGHDLDGPAFPLFDETASIGRERGNILFPEDGYVSGSHCQISVHEGRVYLKDLGSSNGTFLRVRENRVVPSGSLMLMGQQLFRIAYK